MPRESFAGFFYALKGADMLFNTMIQHLANEEDVEIKVKKNQFILAYHGPVFYDSKAWDTMTLKVITKSDYALVKFERAFWTAGDYMPVTMTIIAPIDQIEQFLVGVLGIAVPENEPVLLEEDELDETPISEPAPSAARNATDEAVDRLIELGRENGRYVGRAAATEIVGAVLETALTNDEALSFVMSLASRYGVTITTEQAQTAINTIVGVDSVLSPLATQQAPQADLEEAETAERIRNYARSLGVVVPLQTATEAVRAARNASSRTNASDALFEIAARISVYPTRGHIDHVLGWIL
jgi:uncharacterized membrane protein